VPRYRRRIDHEELSKGGGTMAVDVRSEYGHLEEVIIGIPPSEEDRLFDWTPGMDAEFSWMKDYTFDWLKGNAGKTWKEADPELFGKLQEQVENYAAVVAAEGVTVATGDHYAAYNGTAPIEVSSGGKTRHRLSLGGNRRLNHAIHMAAVTQIRFDTPGRVYDKKLAEGKSKKEALRALKRRISDAVYQRLVADLQQATMS